MSEKLLWTRYSKAWAPDWCQRIDTNRFKGLPDVHWTFRGVAGWTELKLTRLGSFGLIWHDRKLTLEQAMWLDGYARAGGRCCVVGGELIAGRLMRFQVLKGPFRSLVTGVLTPASVVWEGSVMDETFKRAVAGL